MKKRILNKKLAEIVADLRHGEMIYIADSGSNTSEKGIYPLDPSVEYLDLGAVTGSPSFEDIVETLIEAGDFEGAIVPEDMEDYNPKHFGLLTDLLGKEKVHTINYAPEFYELRNRCKAVVRMGDITPYAIAVLVGGYPSADIEMDVLLGKKKYTSIPKKDRK